MNPGEAYSSQPINGIQTMPLIDYDLATPVQQEIFRGVNPQLASEWSRYRIFVKANGDPYRNKGFWQWTEAFAKRTDAAARAAMRGENVRSKGDMREFKTCDFHLDKSP